jgi:hypothetical protein
VTIGKFDPSHVLVNINKLKPCVPYDDNIKGLVFKFQRGKREGITLETHETLEESIEDKGKNKTNEGEGSQKEETKNTLHPLVEISQNVTTPFMTTCDL